MAGVTKVINKAGRTVSILRWKVLPDGRVINPLGEVKDDLPTEVAYSPQAKHLADQGLVSIRGYMSAKAPAEKEPVSREVLPSLPEVDDLTELANIGASRVRKLNGKRIFTFQGLVDRISPAELGNLLQIEEEVATSIIEEAASKLGAGSE